MDQTHRDPLEAVLQQVGGRWKLLIIRQLVGGPERFGELRRRLSGITPKVLTQSLRALEESGLVQRTVYEEVPLRVSYSLTVAGYRMSSLLPVMVSCYTAAAGNSPTKKSESGLYYSPTHRPPLVPLQDRLESFAKAIAGAQTLVVGLGSGVNIGKMDFFSRQLAAEWVPHMMDRAFSNIDEMIDAYSQINGGTSGRFWEFWAPFLHQMGKEEPPSILTDIKKIAQGIDTFIITTNADGLEEKAGFCKEQIYRPLGDYSQLQCALPCCNELYEAEELTSGLLQAVREGREIQDKDCPICPHCGAYLVPNHYRTRIVSLVNDEEARHNWSDFMNMAKTKRTVYLEVGCSLRFPSVVRTPFERAVVENPQAHLIRCNTKTTETIIPLGRQAILFPEGIAQVLSSTAQMVGGQE